MRVAVLDDYQHVAGQSADWALLPPEVDVTFFHDHLPFGPALVGRLAPFEVIGAMRERTPFPGELLGELPNLRLLLTTGSRNAAIDLAAARRLGITVCGTGSHGLPASELAIAHILGLARNLAAEMESMLNGGWQVGVGRSLMGATLGIVGLGLLGRRVAVIGKALGMDVIAYSPHADPRQARDEGVELVETLHAMLARADFVTIHVRLNEDTAGMIGREELAVMKRDAYLVNTSRGQVVDEAALIEACEAGTIAGAAIDVYAEEPLPADHRLRTTPRLHLTPHIGFVTRETYEVFYGEMIENILAYLGGTPIRELSGP